VEALAKFGGHLVKFVSLVDLDGLVRRIKHDPAVLAAGSVCLKLFAKVCA
jgi:hypothetical protein